jgi:hypothetical protein
VSFVLTLLGILLLLIFLAGIGLGVYMATNPNTKQIGWLFALWWVPGAAAATGVLMRDLVTFTVGSVCFLVAGVVFMLKGLSMRRAHMKRSSGPRKDRSQESRGGSRKTAS